MRVLIDRQQDPLQAYAARVEVDEAVHTRRHEQCGQGRPADERGGHLLVQPSGHATALVRSEHHQIGRVPLKVVQNDVGRIVAPDFNLADLQPKGTDSFARAAGREQAPLRERLPYPGKLVGVARRLGLVREVENRQGAPARERQLQGVNERHLAGRRKVRWVEDACHALAPVTPRSYVGREFSPSAASHRLRRTGAT